MLDDELFALALAAARGEVELTPKCPYCGAPVPLPDGTRLGRSRVYCDEHSYDIAEKLHPPHQAGDGVHCRSCDGPVQQSGQGRPRQYCHTCRPPARAIRYWKKKRDDERS